MSVDVALLSLMAAKEAGAFERWQSGVRARVDAAKDEPIAGIKRKTWEPPASWGAVVERIAHTIKGNSVERLRFANGETVDRMTEAVVGIDY